MSLKIVTSAIPITTVQEKCWLLRDQQAWLSGLANVPPMTSVSDYISPCLLGNGQKVDTIEGGICVHDEMLAGYILEQAIDYLQKAFCNVVSHHILASKGLETWARITNYYASYFSVHCLLCLQGRVFTRLSLDKTLQVQIVPLDLRSHIYGITAKGIGKNPHHETPWRRYYDIYDSYAVSKPEYEYVSRKTYRNDPLDENKERNKLNYTPFVGFQEIYNLVKCGGFSQIAVNYSLALEKKISLDDLLTDLQGYTSDADLQYFARTLLKIALIADVLRSLRVNCAPLQSKWDDIFKKWDDFLVLIFPEIANAGYLRKFGHLLAQ